MKKSKKLFSILTLLIILVSVNSCKKTTSFNGYGPWTANINGAAQTGVVQMCSYEKATKTLSIVLWPSLTVHYPNISISGATANGADVAAGTYNLNGTSGFTAIYTASAGGKPFVTDLLGSGQLTISQINLGAMTISGSFNFTGIEFIIGASDSVFVTNGAMPNSTIYEF